MLELLPDVYPIDLSTRPHLNVVRISMFSAGINKTRYYSYDSFEELPKLGDTIEFGEVIEILKISTTINFVMFIESFNLDVRTLNKYSPFRIEYSRLNDEVIVYTLTRPPTGIKYFCASISEFTNWGRCIFG